MKSKREVLREIEGIRLTYVCPPITASSAIVLDLNGKFEKYKPYDVVHVFNNSSSLIYVYINQSDDYKYPVAGKTEREIDKINCWNLKIEEKSGTNIASGDIVLMLERKGKTIDDVAKKFWWF